MDSEKLQLLLEDVKNSQDITWDDPSTDRKYLGMIQDGIAYLDDKAGEELDYFSPGYGRRLLFEYVRYARDAALDVFENNYQSMILAMQNKQMVARRMPDPPVTEETEEEAVL